MESAIDMHLQCPRTLTRRIPDDFQPPFPMYAARAKEDLRQVVMGYYGVQYKGAENRDEAFAALRHIVGSFGTNDGPASTTQPTTKTTRATTTSSRSGTGATRTPSNDGPLVPT